MSIARTKNGWPITPVEGFTVEELIQEASRWAHQRGNGSVGGGEFAKYDAELKRRGTSHWTGLTLR